MSKYSELTVENDNEIDNSEDVVEITTCENENNARKFQVRFLDSERRVSYFAVLYLKINFISFARLSSFLIKYQSID